MRWVISAVVVLFCLCDLDAKERLLERDTGPDEIMGVFNLILYDGNAQEDIRALAILDPVSDRVEVVPYDPPFEYRIVESLKARDAIERALHFLSLQTDVVSYRFKRIEDQKGVPICYEIRPFYLPFTYGEPDVLDTVYLKSGNKVDVYIELKPSVEKTLEGLGSEGWIWGN